MSGPVLDYPTAASAPVERWWVPVLCVGLVITVLGGMLFVIWLFLLGGLSDTTPISAKP